MNSQWRRILTLDRWLREGRRLVAKQAAKEMGVDERTIRRDLKEMTAGDFNLPVAYDRRERVWYYKTSPASLPATIVSESDRFALLLSLQSTEQYRGTPIYGKLKEIYRRLVELMPAATRTSYESLVRKIRFEGPPVPELSKSTWETLFNALDEGTTLKLVYRTGRSGEVHERKVDPYGLVVRHREWYLVGWDHLRKAVRTFLLLRIQAAEDTDNAFRIRDGFNLDEYLSTAVDGHQSTGPVYRVKLRFAREAGAIGEDYVWNATQKVTRDRQGRIIVVFKTGALYAVERQVLGWGGAVEVLVPSELRYRVREKASANHSLHRADDHGDDK